MRVEEAEVTRLAATIDRYRREANFTRALRQPTPLSLSLLIVLLCVHLSAALTDTALGAAGQGVGPSLLHGAKINGLVWGGQWWRLISATFLHGGVLHLAFNAYALFVLGPVVERLYGSRRFFWMYMVCGVVSSLASLLFTAGASVGASGAIFGMLGVLLVFGLKNRAELPPRVSRAFGVGLLPWVVINVVIGFIPGLQIDNAAHIGGLLTGVLVSWPMRTSLTASPVRWRRAVLEVGFALSLLAAAWGVVSMLHQLMVCGAAADYVRCYPLSLLGS